MLKHWKANSGATVNRSPRNQKQLEAAKKNLKPFKKGVSGNPKGRPKNIMKMFQEMIEEDINRSIAEPDFLRFVNTIMSCTVERVSEFYNAPDLPISVKMLIQSLLNDAEKGDFRTIDWIFQRLNGMPEINDKQSTAKLGLLIAALRKSDANPQIGTDVSSGLDSKEATKANAT